MLKRGELFHRWYIKFKMTVFNRNLTMSNLESCMGEWRCICDIQRGRDGPVLTKYKILRNSEGMLVLLRLRVCKDGGNIFIML